MEKNAVVVCEWYATEAEAEAEAENEER